MTQLKSLFQAIDKSKLNVVITYPNADPKFLNIIKFINSKFNKKKFHRQKLWKRVYSSLLKHCKMIVGNSSSGIVEADLLRLSYKHWNKTKNINPLM